MKNDIFYDIKDDLLKYPGCALFFIMGGRGTGKTYSTLKYVYEEKKKFIFLKRTNRDVDLLCNSLKKNKIDIIGDIDISPFKSINRDIGSNVRAFKIYDGFGGFWNCNTDNEPFGDCIGYIISFSMISKFKGFDLSDCEYIIFDEFIPLPYERINRNEGIALADLYRTVGRANNILNNKVLKLICLANATEISCPILNTFEVTDDIVNMRASGESELYLKERSIFIKLIPDINGFRELEEKNPIYKAMKNTKWAKMSLDNDFAYNDFSNVRKSSLKNMSCITRVKYNQKDFYIYLNYDGHYYMTFSKSNHYDEYYDLNRENDQKRFYYNEVIDLQNICIENMMNFESYEMYDIIMNYRDFFKI